MIVYQNLLGFNASTVSEKINLLPSPVDTLSFDNALFETKIAHEMLFKGKRSRTIHKFTMNVDPGYKYIEKFRGGFQWYMTDSKDFFSSGGCMLKNELGNLVSISG